MRRQIGELAIRHPITHSADFFVDRIGPKIHEPDAIVQQLRGRNQRVVWRHLLGLGGILHIEIGAEHYLVVVTIERGVKRRITIVGRAKNQVEHDEARACPEQPIEQERPYFSRPRELPLSH